MKKITLLLLTLSISFYSYAQFPESFDGGAALPAGWVEFVGANGLGTTHQWTVNDTEDYVSVRWSEILGAGLTAEDWIVTPQVAITSINNLLTFDMTDFNAPDYGSEVTVRVSTDASQTNIAAFTTVFTIDELDTNGGAFLPWTVDLNAYVGSSIYVAFVMENNDGDAWGLDNVDFAPLPACLDPTVAFDDFTSTTVDISTNIVANFDVEWGVFPYIQGGGGNTATITNSDTYQLTGLMPGISYNVFVRRNCGGANGVSGYVEVLVGTSPDFSSLPITEDLEIDTDQALLINLGLSFANLTGNWSFGQDDTADGDTTNDFANSPIGYVFSNSTFTDADANATVYIGPFDLTTANEYTFSFMQRNLAAADATTPNKDIEIIVATANDGSANTVLETLDDLDNTSHTQRMASFTPTSDGSYYFGVRDKSAFLIGVTAANVVILDDLSITSQLLSVEEFNANVISHHYNKVSKTLNLESSSMPMSDIEIYSILGQSVISRPLSGTSESINISQLNNGVYLAKVSIDGNSRTIRFIKN